MISYEELSQVFDINNPATLEYFELCDKHTNEPEYFEKHHILPKSIFPQYTKEKWNIVRLSFQDHYRSHEILPYICLRENDRQRMIRAWNGTRNTKSGLAVDKQMFYELKKAFRDIQSERLKDEKNPFFGRKHTDEAKCKIGDQSRGRNLGEKSCRFGVKSSKETKDKIAKGKLRPEEEFIEYLKTQTNCEMLTDYVNMNTLATFVCKNGHEPFEVTPSYLKQGRVCKTCMKDDRDKKTLDRSRQGFITYMETRTDIYLKGEFIGMSEVTEFGCKSDPNHGVTKMTPANSKFRGCKWCGFERIASKKTKPVSEFLDYLKSNTRLELVGEYKNITTRTSFKCINGHGVFNLVPTDIKYGGDCNVCKAEDRLKANKNDKT